MAISEKELDDIVRRISSNDPESADLRSRLERFLQKLERVMSPFNSCSRVVGALLSSINDYDLYGQYVGLRDDGSIRHLVNYANKAEIELPPARSVTALAVKRLREFYVKRNPQAEEFVKELERKCMELNEGDLSPLKYLTEDSSRGLNNGKAEYLADFLYGNLGIYSVPYIEDKRPDDGVSKSVLPYVLSEAEMRRPDAKAGNSGTGLYGALMDVFNGSTPSSLRSTVNYVCKETGVEPLAVRPLAILVANVPDGKQCVKEESIKLDHVERSYIIKGLTGLYERGLAIRSEDGSVRISPALAERLVSEMPEIKGPDTCPLCGGALVLRSGPYGKFYGCSNYGTTGCEYKEKFNG